MTTAIWKTSAALSLLFYPEFAQEQANEDVWELTIERDKHAIAGF